jgi:2-polyprenyl-6-methoxyphenol hydroxylase-like FAD-dependent oxidoreductase
MNQPSAGGLRPRPTPEVHPARRSSARPSAPTDADVLVVGGGVAGLGLAVALAREGLEVLVLEQRRAAGGIHRGDSLLPKSTAVLQRWGVLGAIRSAGAVPLARLDLFHHRVGHLATTPLSAPREPTPYLVLPHARIEATLEAEARASGRVRLLRGARATGVLEDGGRLRGVRYRRGGGEHVAWGRLLVGADGGRSLVRRTLGIEATPFRYDHAYLGLEADRPEGYTDALSLHLHPAGGVLLTPRVATPGARPRVGVGVLVEAGSAARWLGATDAELAEALAARAPLLAGVRLHRAGAHVYALARVHAPHYHGRGAVLLGDAVHQTNPTAGQGMTLALTDAEALACAVGPALREGGDRRLDRALATYEGEVWPRNEALVRRSHLLARFYALRGPRWDWAKLQLVRATSGPIGRRLGAAVQRAFLESPTPSAAWAAPLPLPARP